MGDNNDESLKNELAAAIMNYLNSLLTPLTEKEDPSQPANINELDAETNTDNTSKTKESETDEKESETDEKESETDEKEWWGKLPNNVKFTLGVTSPAWAPLVGPLGLLLLFARVLIEAGKNATNENPLQTLYNFFSQAKNNSTSHQKSFFSTLCEGIKGILNKDRGINSSLKSFFGIVSNTFKAMGEPEISNKIEEIRPKQGNDKLNDIGKFLKETGKNLIKYANEKNLEINAQKQKDKAMNYEYPDPIQYLQYIHENTPLLLNMAIGKYVYRIVLENDQRNRFILTESFVDNASGKRFLHVLAVSIPTPPAKPIIEYLGKSDQNGKSLFYVSPEPILPIPIDIDSVEASNVLQQNNTEMNPTTIAEIRLAEQKKGDLFYIPTETYNTEVTEPDCEKIFGRSNLSLVYKHLPVFVEKYLANAVS